VQVSHFSTQGARDHNEDTIYPEPGQAQGDLFIIADGMGGHSDGKIASGLACDSLRRIIEREDPATFVLGGHRMSEKELMEAFLSDAVRQAGAVVWHESRQRGSDMGSTVLAVLLKDGRGHCAHIGDGALFVSEDGQLPPVKLTTEHRRGSNLTRSLGAQEQVTPDVFSFTFTDESALVMGCDGFWEHVTPEHIGQLLVERPPFCVAAELGRAALEAGSSDNVSVIVVEGESFVARHAAHQIELYAKELAEQHNRSDWAVQRQALLEFGNRCVDLNPDMTTLMTQVRDRLSDVTRTIEVEPPTILVAAQTPNVQAHATAPHTTSADSRPDVMLEEIGVERQLRERIVHLERERADLIRRFEDKAIEQSRTIRSLEAKLETSQTELEKSNEEALMLGRQILRLWKDYPKQCEGTWGKEWLIKLERWIQQHEVTRPVQRVDRAG
jgi:protein phosphatase